MKNSNAINTHNNICSKLTQPVGVINRLKYEYHIYNNRNILQTLFLPHLKYRISVLDSETASIHKSINKVRQLRMKSICISMSRFVICCAL